MKVTTNSKQADFKPVELTITIESEEELCNLWHRMNKSEHTMNENLSVDDVLKYKCSHSGHKLWKALDQIILDLRLRESI